jgi:threonine aldolase
VPSGFASDNSAPAHPDVLAAVARVNDGHVTSYGHDPATDRLQQRLGELFGTGSRALLVFNGSAANVLCLRAACRPWEAVICTETAHLNVDEAGAAEALAGVKLLGLATPDGKLTPELVESRIERIGDEHAVQPRVVSVTQSTELGTRYTPDELAALAEHAHANGLLLHVDGARLANAAAAVGTSLAAVSTEAGADLVSFGATKNGLLFGEAVIVGARAARAGVADGLPYLRMQTLQLASKMRYLTAQFEAYLDGELWRRTATHANAMATRLAAAVDGIPGVEVTQPVQANGVFACLPREAIAPLQARYPFHVWDERESVARWMCAWDTTPEDVDDFAAAIRQTLELEA